MNITPEEVGSTVARSLPLADSRKVREVAQALEDAGFSNAAHDFHEFAGRRDEEIVRGTLRKVDYAKLRDLVVEGETTVGGYLTALLETLWEEGYSFSGKRPFGDSGWQYCVYNAMARARYIRADIDSDGDPTNVDYKHADKIIARLIKWMMTG